MSDEKKYPDEVPDTSSEIEHNEVDNQPVSADIGDTDNPLVSEIPKRDNDLDDEALDNTLETLQTLNLSIEDQTLAVEIINEADLDDTPSSTTELEQAEDVDSVDLNVMSEAATELVSALSEEDQALLDKVTSPDDDLDEEIIIKDFLNEDDGEPLATPDYLKPPEPEWKVVARQLREEREEKRREVLEKKREDDKRISEAYDARLKEREQTKKQQEAQIREERAKLEQEKKQAVEDMMQRIREERERKQQERAEIDEQEFGRQFTYPKPTEQPSYPKPSEIKRMEREQPKNEVDLTDTNKPSPPTKAPTGDDFNSRVSRLSKPDTPSDTKPADDDMDKED